VELYNFSKDLRNDELTNKEKYDSFVAFKTYYDRLCDDILKKQVFSDDQLAQHIFDKKWDDKQSEMIFKKHLFAAKMTLSRYDKLVTERNFKQFNFVLSMLAHDLFSIVRHGEEHYRQVQLQFDMGARLGQDAREVFDVAEAMLHFGTIDPENAYLREVIPVSIFLLRQTIEVYGKKTLGFRSITDRAGNRARNASTQVAWNFIKAETKKKKSRIKLPANVDTIIKVEEWTNSYVHTGDTQRIFIIDNAIHFVKKLIYPMNTTVRNYKNSIKDYGTTQITSYNVIKDDFERFVNPPKPKKQKIIQIWSVFLTFIGIRKRPKDIIVNWVDVDRVDATILSL
jgi:hypothetical protein